MTKGVVDGGGGGGGGAGGSVVVGRGRRRRVVSTGSVVSEGGGGGGAAVVDAATVVTVLSLAGGTAVVPTLSGVDSPGDTTVVPVSTFVLPSSSPLTAFTEKPTTSPSATPPAIELDSHLRG